MIALKKNPPVEIFTSGILGLLLGLVSLWSSPLTALGILLGITLLVVLLKHPELGVIGFLVLTSTIFSANNIPSFHIGIGTIYLTDILLMALLAMVLIHLITSKGEKTLHSPLTLPILLFIGIALFSTILGILQSYLTLNQVLGATRTIINYLTFFIVLYLCREKNQLKLIFNGIILAATLVSAIMIIQFIAGPSLRLLAGRIEVLNTEGIVNPSATRIIPPGYPLISVALISLTVSFLLEGYRKIPIVKLLQWFLIGIGVLITYKRHIWGIVALSILIMFFFIPWQKRMKVIFLSQILILMIVIVSFLFIQIEPTSRPAILVDSFLVRVSSIFQSNTYEDNSSLRRRDFEYQYAIPQIVAHPLLGLGLGAMYRPYVPYRDNENFDGRTFTHNGHIGLMLKTGLLGYLCYIWFALVFLYRGFKNWRSISNPLLQKIVIGFTLSFLGLLLGSFIEPMVIEWDCTALIGIMMGMSEVILLYYGKQQIEEKVDFI
jgi:O-antigen ligase